MIHQDGNSPESCNLDTETSNEHKMNKIPVHKPEEFQDNPFTYELSIPVTEIISDVEFKETVDGVLVNKTLYTEKTQKVEIYIHESSKSNVAGLSDRAQRLFLHILYSLSRKQDWLYINRESYMKKNNVKSKTTYNLAITELHRYHFIQPTHKKGFWWINPHRFFPGNRVTKYPDKLRVVQKWDKSGNNE